jgi:hypothetical protein
LSTSFYLQDGDHFLSTDLTRGPWDPGLQHGGPPSALLCRAFEGLAGEMQVVRVSVEMLRPIPIAPVSVTAAITRAGRKATWLSGSLSCDGKEILRATATALRVTEGELPPHLRPSPTLDSPESAKPFSFPFFTAEVGYHSAMELRLERGEWGKGPCAGWLRMRWPLVAGEEPTPLQRAVVAADAGNGLSITLPVDRFTVLNPDLTVVLHRPPRGEWIGMDAVTVPEPMGIGLAQSLLHDRDGLIGRSLQTLVVEERSR